MLKRSIIGIYSINFFKLKEYNFLGVQSVKNNYLLNIPANKVKAFVVDINQFENNLAIDISDFENIDAYNGYVISEFFKQFFLLSSFLV